jgi:hypothetical protein
MGYPAKVSGPKNDHHEAFALRRSFSCGPAVGHADAVTYDGGMQFIESLVVALAIVGSFGLMIYGVGDHRDGAAIAGAILLGAMIIASQLRPRDLD